MIGEIIFWAGIAALGYAYLGYPILLLALSPVMKYRPSGRPPALPLSMIVAAHNEAPVIGDKIANFLNLECGGDSELIVVSDASTDGTDEIVSGFNDPRVILLRQDPQAGKSAALNRAVSAAKGEILVFSDANSIFQRDALIRLTEPFGDPRVGAVSGLLQYTGGDTGEGLYWRYEQRVKRLESAAGRLLGANGAIYAIRRDLYPHLDPLDVNDFRVPYEALLRGFRAILVPEAVAVEEAAPTVGGEMARKVRIMSRAIPMFLSLLPRTLAAGRPLVAWQLLSHKVLREMQALCFLLMLSGAIWATAAQTTWGPYFLSLQVLGYGVGAAGWAIPRLRRLRPIQAATYLTMIAAASVLALIRWLTGRNRAIWRRTQRAQESGHG